MLSDTYSVARLASVISKKEKSSGVVSGGGAGVEIL